jgi:hypothetical protein
MTTHGLSPEDDSLGALFESSPDRPVHTSAAAESALLLGLVALAAVPFSITFALALGAAAVGAFFGMVGIATTSRPDVAGRALVPLGLALCFATLVLVGLRYLGLDTAFGDGLVPTLGDWLGRLNDLVPRP